MSIKYSSLPNRDYCTGCRVCRDVCSVNAIKMIADKHGFFYPSVDYSICIGCRICEETCPILHEPEVYVDIMDAYVGKHKDQNVLERSASGGAFSAIVSAFKPDVVCGVRWDAFEAKNDMATSDNELKLFSKSKYILSDSNNIYKRAAQELKDGRSVLFSGSPCQVAAFRNYVGQLESEKLLLVDIVCHGAPSAQLLQMHLKELEKQNDKKIVSWSFRDKTPINGQVSSRSARVDYADKTWRHFEIWQNAYLKLYYNRVAYRKSCGNCPFAKPERVSDITICDAHHIDKLYSDMDVEKGASTILFHTLKSKNLMIDIEKIMNLRRVEYSWIVNNNEQLYGPTIIHSKTNLFYTLIDNKVSFDMAVRIVTHKSFFSRVLDKIYANLGIR